MCKGNRAATDRCVTRDSACDRLCSTERMLMTFLWFRYVRRDKWCKERMFLSQVQLSGECTECVAGSDGFLFVKQSLYILFFLTVKRRRAFCASLEGVCCPHAPCQSCISLSEINFYICAKILSTPDFCVFLQLLLKYEDFQVL